MATPTEQVTTNIPEWLKAPMQRLVATAEAQMGLGYQPYVETDAQGNPIIDPATGLPRMRQRIAEFTPQQMQAFQNIAGMQTADQIRQASGMAGLAGLDARDLARYTAAAERNFYDSPAFREMQTGFERVSAPGATQFQMAAPERVGIDALRQYQMSPAQQVRSAELERLGMVAPREVYAPSLERFRMTGPERVAAERFGLGAMQEYMSPYMQGVVERQKRAAVQDFRRQIPGIGAASARVGGRGGTREALLESEARRGLSERLSDIEAQGLQAAYQQAAGQFGQDRAAMMQAALANQAAAQQAEQQNLQAALQTQGLGAQQALQAALANQQMGYNVGAFNVGAEQQRQQLMAQQALEAQRLNQAAGLTTEQANQQAALQVQQLGSAQALQAALANQAAQQRAGETNLQALINQYQFGAGQGLTAQQMNQQAQLQAQQQALAQLASANQFGLQNAAQRAQYGLAGANLAEQSRQFGAGLGLQGVQQQLAAAGTLGGLGQQQYQQQMGINAAQLGAGGQQQALNQELLNTQYQDFLNAQRFPYQQMEFMSGILRGLPATGQTQTMYQQPGSLFGQIAGIGLGLGSLFGGFGSTTQPPR